MHGTFFCLEIRLQISHKILSFYLFILGNEVPGDKNLLRVERIFMLRDKKQKREYS